MIARAIAMVAIAACAIPVLAAPAPAGQEIWSIQFDTFYHGSMDVQLLRDGERIAAGIAFDTVRNPPMLLDTSRLRVVGGHLQGPMSLSAAPLVYTASTKPGAGKPTPQEEVLLDVKADHGRLSGAISSPKPVATGVIDRHMLQGKPNSLPVWGRAHPNLQAQRQLMPPCIETLLLSRCLVGQQLDQIVIEHDLLLQSAMPLEPRHRLPLGKPHRPRQKRPAAVKLRGLLPQRQIRLLQHVVRLRWIPDQRQNESVQLPLRVRDLNHKFSGCRHAKLPHTDQARDRYSPIAANRGNLRMARIGPLKAILTLQRCFVHKSLFNMVLGVGFRAKMAK